MVRQTSETIMSGAIIVSDVCLTIQAPVAQYLRHWSRKPEISDSILGRAYLSFFLIIKIDGEAVKI